MYFRKTLSVILTVCLLLTAFAAMPSVRAQAMSADIVVIRSASADVRTEADPYSASRATATLNSTFHTLGSKTGSDGRLWHNIIYSSSYTGWVSSDDVSALTASSTTVDPHTRYLKRMAQVIVPTFELRSKPGTSGTVVGTVSKNDRMVVLGYGDDGSGKTWYEVRYGDINGWIIRTAVTVHNQCYSPKTVDCSKEIPVIYLSPSRQPANPFAAGNTNEWEQMTRVADALKVILEHEYECIVHMAKFETPITKFNRPLEAYNLGADIYLAIHSNAASGSAKAYGTQGYYFPGNSQNKLMAENLVKRISAISPFPDTAEGIYNGMTYLNGVGYGEVRDPGGFGMQSILLEVEFHDRPDCAQWIIDNTQNIARAIADGLNDTYHFRAKGNPPTTTTTTTTTTSAAITTGTTVIQDGFNPLGTTTTTTLPTTSVTTTTSTTASTTTSTIPTETTTTTSENITTTTTIPAPVIIPEIVRAGGEDRIDTAVRISAMGWDRADTVIIASGSSYPDALAGVPLSGAADAPILLTTGRNAAEDKLLSEVSRLGAKKAYILGGNSAVSSGVEDSLTAAGVTCTRLAGSDRYETGIIIAKELSRLTGKSFDTLYFASAENFPDALAISPVAAIEGSPILYIGANSKLTSAMSDYVASLGCKKAVLLGGEAAVSDTGKASIENMGINVERISGADRYATGLAIAQRFSGVFDGKGVALATGGKFPDALAGGAHAAKLGVPVLLVGSDAGTDLLSFAGGLNSGNVYVYGGTGAVSDVIAQAVLSVMD